MKKIILSLVFSFFAFSIQGLVAANDYDKSGIWLHEDELKDIVQVFLDRISSKKLNKRSLDLVVGEQLLPEQLKLLNSDDTDFLCKKINESGAIGKQIYAVDECAKKALKCIANFPEDIKNALYDLFADVVSAQRGGLKTFIHLCANEEVPCAQVASNFEYAFFDMNTRNSKYRWQLAFDYVIAKIRTDKEMGSSNADIRSCISSDDSGCSTPIIVSVKDNRVPSASNALIPHRSMCHENSLILIKPSTTASSQVSQWWSKDLINRLQAKNNVLPPQPLEPKLFAATMYHHMKRDHIGIGNAFARSLA